MVGTAGGPVHGGEQILEDRAQHELDAVSSFLAIRAEEDAAAEPDE